MSIPFTWIYIIYDAFTDLYKIGKSDAPLGRLKQLRSEPTIGAAPKEYTLIEAWLAPESNEKKLHDYFKPYRIRGEWFDLPRYFAEKYPHWPEFRHYIEFYFGGAFFLNDKQWSDGKSYYTTYLENVISVTEHSIPNDFHAVLTSRFGPDNGLDQKTI